MQGRSRKRPATATFPASPGLSRPPRCLAPARESHIANGTGGQAVGITGSSLLLRM